MKIVPLGRRATAAESSSVALACSDAEAARQDVEIDASETARFGPMGVAMLASSFALRRTAGWRTTLIGPIDAAAAEFLDEVGFERSASGQPPSLGTLELRQMRALDAVYTECIADLLVQRVPGITEENSYPIQLCLNELLQTSSNGPNRRSDASF